MLKENELRIGNYLYDAIGNIGSVVISGNSFVLSTEDRGYVSLQECTPIPLTPEILEKCGFEAASNYHPEGKVFKIKGFEIAPLYHMVDYVQSGDRIRIQNIEHLHQLQNLYYALIGTELEINL